MTRSMRSRVAARLLAATLGLTVTVGLTTTPAFAQNEPPLTPEEEKAAGRPFDGYMATGCLIGLALFLIGKSARRQ
jgi:hypothetical protein